MPVEAPRLLVPERLREFVGGHHGRGFHAYLDLVRVLRLWVTVGRS